MDMETKSPYELRATGKAMPIDKDHAIRFISRNWKRHDLTQEQWEKEVCPRIVKMLAECNLVMCNSVGEGELLSTNDDALEALQYPVIIAGKDLTDTKLSDQEKKHVKALEWAFRNLMTHSEVLEVRIKKIIGAALTCLIEPKVFVGRETAETVGVAVVKFPELKANKILTECMKAYRVYDESARWDINGFEAGEETFGKAFDGRHYLACCAMIDMQMGLWLEKAKQHLAEVGLANVNGVLLGEADIPSRSSLLSSSAHNHIKVITGVLPLAVNNNDWIPTDVGFATAGGKVLAKLAPLMFKWGQSLKDHGCTWQLIGGEYLSVWLTVGTEVSSPFPPDVGKLLLQAFRKCPEDSFLLVLDKARKYKLEQFVHNWAGNRRSDRLPTIWDHYYIPPIDEEGEDYYS